MRWYYHGMNVYQIYDNLQFEGVHMYQYLDSLLAPGPVHALQPRHLCYPLCYGCCQLINAPQGTTMFVPECLGHIAFIGFLT